MRRQRPSLEVTVPSFFRCPISLDVMKSPVSLCTGVTYDRSSIQRWLDSGHSTCPATMLPLPSTLLVPNLTLRRLISQQLHTASSSPAAASDEYKNDDDPVPALRELAAFFSDDDFDHKNTLAARGAATAITVLKKVDASVEALESAVTLLALILASDAVDNEHKKPIVTDLRISAESVLSPLTRVLAGERKTDAATVLYAVISASDAESKATIAEREELISELIRLVGAGNENGGTTGLACLAALAGDARRARAGMVRLGVVEAASRSLAASGLRATAAGSALCVLEAAAMCAEGRAEIGEAAEEVVSGVVGRMMKAGLEGAEAAVTVLWTVCCKYRDRRAVEAAAKAGEEGMTKLLLLMQSGCSPAVRQMAAELMKMFRPSVKSGGGIAAAYDSKTKHIMPF